jgi:hypothetical protein
MACRSAPAQSVCMGGGAIERCTIDVVEGGDKEPLRRRAVDAGQAVAEAQPELQIVQGPLAGVAELDCHAQDVEAVLQPGRAMRADMQAQSLL